MTLTLRHEDKQTGGLSVNVNIESLIKCTMIALSFYNHRDI